MPMSIFFNIVHARNIAYSKNKMTESENTRSRNVNVSVHK